MGIDVYSIEVFLSYGLFPILNILGEDGLEVPSSVHFVGFVSSA